MAEKKETKKTSAKKEPTKSKIAKKSVVSKKAVSDSTVKKPAVSKKTKAVKNDGQSYFAAVGRRKTAVAQVRIYENAKATEADVVVNGKEMKDYFPSLIQQNTLLAPLKETGTYGKFAMTVLVGGGGNTGQVEAIQLGIARALVKFDEGFKKTLRSLGMLTRDSRKVERKKPGLKKARRAPQWAKR